MSRKTEQTAKNVVLPNVKETNAHTKQKVDATEIKVAEIRITEGTGNPRGRHLGVSAVIAA